MLKRKFKIIENVNLSVLIILLNINAIIILIVTNDRHAEL
jgi:hypothetical protein